MRLPFRKRSETRSDPAFGLNQFLEQLNYLGNNYPFIPNQSLSFKTEEISSTYESLVASAYRANGVVFACCYARQRLFSEARFQFRRRSNGRPGDYFGTDALVPLEKPWPNATTGDLLTRAIADVDLSGNFFAYRPNRKVGAKGDGTIVGVGGDNTLRRMRPDWVSILAGSESDPADAANAIDAEIIAYFYHPGGPQAKRDPIMLLPQQVAHFAPVPDPWFRFRGMSWLVPVVTDIMGDNAASTHKLKFFENGATVNQAVMFDPLVNADKAKVWIEKFKDQHEGLVNAYKTLYLGGGAVDIKTLGSDLKQADFKEVIGHSETRIAAAAGIPPIIVGLSEGLEAATYSNYGQARRAFADGTMRPLWRNFAGSMQSVIDIPGGVELWYDDRDIPFLQEDQQDNAAIQMTRSQTIHTLVTAGFTPESVITAVMADDMSLLAHTGMYSVQLLPAGTVGEGKGSVVSGTPEPTDGATAPDQSNSAAAQIADISRTNETLRQLLTRNPN